MKFKTQLAVFLVLQYFFLSPALAATTTDSTKVVKTSWEPSHTWIFSVGVLQWKDKSMAKFTGTHRRDAAIVKSLESSGVPADHIVYLQDSQATLKIIREKLSKLLAQIPPGDTLFVYYCGHGWMTDAVGYYGNYDAGDDPATCWSTRTLSSDLRAFKGANVVIVVDCCQSGSIIKAMQDSDPEFNWGVLTAAVASQSSTGNWTFSQSLLDCLNGHRYADINSDGVVTFSELAAYMRDEMKFFEHQDSAVGRSSGFDPAFKIGVVTFPSEQIPQRAEAKWEKEWWPVKIVQTKGDQAKVHWLSIGWDAPNDDEWVPLTRIRNIKGANSGTASATTSSTASGAAELAVGSKIEAKYEGEWYPAKIIKVDGQKYFIHYDAYDNSWDEWITAARIK